MKEHPEIDVTVDGADEVSPDLDLIKGLGGALVREKIVAHASKRVIIVVDDSKMVEKLGTRAPIPVEVVPFAVDSVMLQLVRWKGSVKIRERNGQPFVSDNGNTILDWQYGAIDDPHGVEIKLKSDYRRCGFGNLCEGGSSGDSRRRIIDPEVVEKELGEFVIVQLSFVICHFAEGEEKAPSAK